MKKNQMKPYIQGVIEESIQVKSDILASTPLLEAVAQVARLCIDAYERGNKLLLAGNGGSAGDAQHIAAELVARFEKERAGLPAIALTTDTSMITAIGNDYGYEQIFSRQIEAQAKEGDIFIGISTSGNSANIIRAMEKAKSLGVLNIGLCGSDGKIYEVADYTLGAPSTNTARIQEAHIMLGHILCGLIENSVFPK